MCHFEYECHWFGLYVNCFENVEFDLTAAPKQSMHYFVEISIKRQLQDGSISHCLDIYRPNHYDL